MTNEEAVRVLNTCIAATHIKGLPMGKTEDVREALAMGAEALGYPDEDRISRQAAINKMQDLEDEDIKAYGCAIPEGFDGKRAIEALKALPSVQPKPKHWIDGEGTCPCCGKDKFAGLDADIWADWKPRFCPNCGAKMLPADSNCDSCKHQNEVDGSNCYECVKGIRNNYTAELRADRDRLQEAIKALGEDIRKCQKIITDEDVLIGFNMAVALCNKHLAESEKAE